MGDPAPRKTNSLVHPYYARGSGGQELVSRKADETNRFKEALTLTQQLVIKGIRKAENEDDWPKADFLRKLWGIERDYEFPKAKTSLGDASIHVGVNLARVACCASNRDRNTTRNVLCIVIADYLCVIFERDGYSDSDEKENDNSHMFDDFEEPPDVNPEQFDDEDDPFNDVDLHSRHLRNTIDSDIWHVRLGGLCLDDLDVVLLDEGQV